jgi:hypothetical protein
MLSIGLSRWYINITITILDIIHRLVFYLKHDVSEAGFCLRLQTEPTQMGLIEEPSLSQDPSGQVPHEDGDKIQSPKRRV